MKENFDNRTPLYRKMDCIRQWLWEFQGNKTPISEWKLVKQVQIWDVQKLKLVERMQNNSKFDRIINSNSERNTDANIQQTRTFMKGQKQNPSTKYANVYRSWEKTRENKIKNTSFREVRIQNLSLC